MLSHFVPGCWATCSGLTAGCLRQLGRRMKLLAMPFEQDLAATRKLAEALFLLDAELSGLVLAEDRGWLKAGQVERLEQVVAEHARLSATVMAELTKLGAWYAEPWRAFVAESMARLQALARANDVERFAAGDVLYTWERFARGEPTDGVPVKFARLLRLLR